MNLRHCALLSLAAAALALPVASSIASTCKDELNRFESRLYDSPVPAKDPQLFQELVREAERAAELRDERQCLERVAELNEALPENDVRPPTGRATPDQAKSDEAARPKAPILLVTDSESAAEDATAEDEPAAVDAEPD